ncbi:hypothetical protein HPB52_005100 [Rhipicephalus sanguineus]|uniref:Uncharacterized protein n=1 Tax=Rhipicephalus sanguineus TaxID=34632 RepID=A0A9D4QGN3_RHISA|nr:hypothetical protein HPB52_005100 [Rhipicephalus sanguineus]
MTKLMSQDDLQDFHENGVRSASFWGVWQEGAASAKAPPPLAGEEVLEGGPLYERETVHLERGLPRQMVQSSSGVPLGHRRQVRAVLLLRRKCRQRDRGRNPPAWLVWEEHAVDAATL